MISDTKQKQSNDQAEINNIALLYKGFLRSLVRDATAEALQQAALRHTMFMKEMFTPKDFYMTTFENDGLDEMVVQRGISVYALCEQHVVPFFGEAVVAYIPRKRIVGLSKLSRTVEYCARGLQTQERITHNIAQMLALKLKPKGVAVSLKARHLCMEMRGVRKPGSETITTALYGAFKSDAACREEFLSHTR